MEAVEFLGLSFRSSHHMHWFQCSMMFLGLSVIWFFVTRSDDLHSTIVWKFLGVYHALAFVLAGIELLLNYLKNQPIDGGVSSVDCIWFNAIMVFIYCTGLLVAKHYEL